VSCTEGDSGGVEEVGMVQLVPMTEDDYQPFIVWAMEDYAQQQVKAGAWRPENAEALAQQAFEALLPQGLSSSKQFLYVIERDEDGEKVGYVWYGIREEEEDRFVALYDLVIFEPYRRLGHGSGALQAMERQVREKGMERVVLHVFGHNEGARALYKKMGYVERNVTMMKELGG
jgi:ribosomal protein S18 acetylase RimI-like enzyme